MEMLILLYMFTLGSIFGSFALVLVDRTKSGKDWVRGRSECAFCHTALRARDLIPLFSWLFSSGKCRYCRKKLSVAYPLVEVGLGVCFVLSYLFWPVELQGYSEFGLFIIWLASLVVATVLFIYDLRWFVLPSSFLYSFVLIALLYKIVWVAVRDVSIGEIVVPLVLALSVSAGLFSALYVLSKGKWIGDGDIFIGLAMGLFLPGPFETWFAICVASVAGLIMALPKMVKNGRNLKMKIPFGPLLLSGLFVSFFSAEAILRWYVDTFLFLP